eukprot:scaffold21158_cov62-Phaeocystis_antarctica.AAC.2
MQRTLGRFQTTVSVSALLNKVSNCSQGVELLVVSGRCHSPLGRIFRANALFEAVSSAKVASTSVRLNIGVVLKLSLDPDFRGRSPAAADDGGASRVVKTRTSPVSPKATWRRPSSCTSIILPRP